MCMRSSSSEVFVVIYFIMERKIERSRAANFTIIEEKLLLKIVNLHGAIIRNKKTDAVTNALKVKEWEIIAEEFNSQNLEQSRDAGTLRRKYENIKRRFKKKLKQGKISDGHQEKVMSIDDEAELMQVIGNEAFEFDNTHEDDDNATQDSQITESFFFEACDVNKGNYDNDVETKSCIVINSDVETAEVNEPSEIPVSTTSVDLPKSMEPSVGQASDQLKSISNDCQHSDPIQPSSLAFSPNPTLRNRRRDFAHNNMSAWAKLKSKLAEQELCFKKELHEQKMRHLEEEHAMRKQLLVQQLRHAEEKHSWLREEHLENMEKINSSI